MIIRNSSDTEFLVQNRKNRAEFRGLGVGVWYKGSKWTANAKPICYDSYTTCKILAPYELIEWES